MEGTATTGFAQSAKLERIAIMSLSFDGILTNGLPQPDAVRTLDVMDLPQIVADRYGVRRLDMQHAHFLSTDADYLKTFRERVAKAKSQITQINLEFAASNVSAQFSPRAQAIDLTRSWIDHAVALGCARVMVNPGALVETMRQNAIDALKIIAEYGKARNVTVSIENRDTGVVPMPPPPPPPAPAAPAGAAPGGRGGGRQGGPAAPPPPPPTWQVVADVIKASGLSATPNTLNFPNEAERTAGLKVLFGLSAGTCHCPVDPGKYRLADAIKIAKEAGYKGVYALQTSGPDPHAAMKAALDELLKNI